MVQGHHQPEKMIHSSQQEQELKPQWDLKLQKLDRMLHWNSEAELLSGVGFFFDPCITLSQIVVKLDDIGAALVTLRRT
ncbi:hypothetical protein ACJIZ3_017898 [Penstemon smallii]|uniref:Uncharacterized protein n=1 Tax=Penstemon smallii TaxID=265156 RepID=A0ABD3SXE9_9LAMI